jgi:hypothetical protein
MLGINKKLKSFKNEHILGIVGFIFLLVALYKYSETKTLLHQPMTTNTHSLSPSVVQENTNNKQNSVIGTSNATSYAPYNGAPQRIISNSATSSVQMNKPVTNPSDLLPSDNNSSWSNMNPVSDLKNINLLNPTQMVGINTQGSSLRNSNLQLRSEPANPRTLTNCPWNNTTIESDKFRRPLEIGSSI